MNRRRILAVIAALAVVLGLLLTTAGCSNKVFNEYESDTYELGGAGISAIA